MTYTTDWEISYLRSLYNKNRGGFLNYAKLVMSDTRSWEGEGMAVNVNAVKSEIRRLIQAHENEKRLIGEGVLTQ